MLLVDQPWQANLGLRIAKAAKRINQDLDFSIVFTDYFTFFLRRDYLVGIKNAFDGEVWTQEEIYRNWQTETETPDVDGDFLTEWELLNCSDRTLAEIARTNQWLYGNERDKYQRKISNAWKDRILYDSINWCEMLINRIEPDYIVSIERCTLPTNLLYQISLKRDIPFKTFIPARIDKRWVIRTDLAYGMSSELQDKIIRDYSDKDSLALAEQFAQDLVLNRQGSYSSPSHRIVADSLEKKSAVLQNLRREIRKFIGRVYGRIFIQPKERSIDSVRVLENFVALSFVELKQILVTYAHHLGLRVWGRTSLPKEPYFFWALHMRPEGSVLVLGDAREEVAELIRTADLIPEGHKLVVKENPEMFGLREFAFYRRLKRHRKIILMDPHFPTFEILRRSSGVIGISGTVLLEAAIFDKPSYALGHPEFVGFIVGSGWNGQEIFFKNVLDNNFDSPKAKMLPYLAYVLNEGFENSIPFEGDLQSLEAEQMIQNFAATIAKFSESETVL
jgi:hypothetical protein